ncbi:UNKNOWN [Stylonychia lemnae]|uniref:Uncharacterized protein n=1 Tax=Stylonychia lemnae TaxID=5949 RepID=A0A078A0G5_STYLE|nr:UNKNOWN [Stylonychia lemnae]|eukprot:CDW74943.1 UNKNOWN [Stylonychia lemnae]
MNFIVAVISESYEKVMQKIVAETYKVKVQMIREREQLLTKMSVQRARKMVRQFSMIFQGEWQGFIKDIKSTIKTTASRSKSETMQNLAIIQNSNLKLHAETRNRINETSKRFDERFNEIKQSQDIMKERIEGLERLLKESLSNLLQNASKQQQ